MEETIEIDGREIGLGPMPMCLRETGFASRAEVREVAAKHTLRAPGMTMGDVADYLSKSH